MLKSNKVDSSKHHLHTSIQTDFSKYYLDINGKLPKKSNKFMGNLEYSVRESKEKGLSDAFVLMMS